MNKVFATSYFSLNKPVKDFYRHYYDEWLRNGPFEYARGGNLKSCFKTQIEWLLTACREVPSEVVRRSFAACGITQCDPSAINYMKPGRPSFFSCNFAVQRTQLRDSEPMEHGFEDLFVV